MFYINMTTNLIQQVHTESLPATPPEKPPVDNTPMYYINIFLGKQ